MKSGYKLLLSITAATSALHFSGFLQPRYSRAELERRQQFATVYKTIIGSHDLLLGYQLHQQTMVSPSDSITRTHVFNAIVKDIDPTQDNYEALCTDIIKDIVAQYGYDNLVVNIFDSTDAYTLHTQNALGYYTQSGHVLRDHWVATYNASNNNVAELVLYPEAAPFLRQQISLS